MAITRHEKGPQRPALTNYREDLRESSHQTNMRQIFDMTRNKHEGLDHSDCYKNNQSHHRAQR